MGEGFGAAEEDAYCELSIAPSVDLIASVRRFVESFYVSVLECPSVRSRLVVAAHELTENAARYSIDGRSRIRLGIVPEPNGWRVAIATRNRADERHRAALRELLAEQRSSPDRTSFYRMRLSRSLEHPIGAGLGLARVYAESELDVSCAVHGDTVHLVAQRAFDVGGHADTTKSDGAG
jgi:hypothetical protein